MTDLQRSGTLDGQPVKGTEFYDLLKLAQITGWNYVLFTNRRLILPSTRRRVAGILISRFSR